MADIILSEAQKLEDRSERVKKFQAGFDALMKETSISMKPQITPDGPSVILIDTKYEDQTS